MRQFIVSKDVDAHREKLEEPRRLWSRNQRLGEHTKKLGSDVFGHNVCAAWETKQSGTVWMDESAGVLYCTVDELISCRCFSRLTGEKNQEVRPGRCSTQRVTDWEQI